MVISETNTNDSVVLKDGYYGEIEVFSLENKHASKKDVVVLPNGYGNLKYCRAVGKKLSESWSKIYIPSLRGQGASKGTLTIHGGAKDVYSLCQKINPISKKKIIIIVHCSAIFYLLALIEKEEFWRKIEGVILYGYLAKPLHHIERFEKKAKKYGVNVQYGLEDIEGINSSLYARIPVPFYVIHPLNRINLLRATKTQLDELKMNGNPSLIATPKKGYEILNSSQYESVSRIVKDHFNPIISGNIS